MKSGEDTALWVETTRLEALCDGVFAIAMTLLVLELRFASPIGSELPGFQMLLRGRLYNFVSFVVSFLIIAIFWIIHHEQFSYIKKTDIKLIFINTLTMLFIALLPITTAIMNDFKHLSAAQIIFDGNILIIGVLLSVNWSYASSGGRLTGGELAKEHLLREKKKPLVIVGVALAALILSVFFQHWGDFAYVLLPFLLWGFFKRGES